MEKEELRFSLFLLSSHLTTIMLGWCWNVCFCWLQVEGMYNIIADLLGKQWFQMISGRLFLKNPLWCRRMLCLALAGCDTKEAKHASLRMRNTIKFSYTCRWTFKYTWIHCVSSWLGLICPLCFLGFSGLPCFRMPTCGVLISLILTPSCLHARKLTWNPSLEKAIYTKLMSS